ncbi:MAG: ribosome biogenesis GTPase YlqF [Clostridia bacterium]|nr:ribosome biogenesis GTPase YlqF [Clostridia bacterium]
MEENKTNINWYPGHMAKTKKQIQDDLKLVDVVIEILDARAPKSSQNPDMAKIIDGKKRIVILNKSDLSDENENKRWQSYFNTKNTIAIIANCNTGTGTKEVIGKINEIMKDELIKHEQKGRVQKNIRVMVLGIPNVGKSSFINRITKKNSAIVGNKPGVTKQKQWVRIDNNVELLDTPGVLWPKFENKEVALNLSFIGAIKDEIIDEYEIAYHLINFLNENYQTELKARYKLTDDEIDSIYKNNSDNTERIIQIIELIGKKRGAIMSGGAIDQNKVARVILEDFRSGKIGRITLEKVK